MKTIDYKEIYYASTECSIITHSPGIGIRTYTEGMNPNDVSKIVENCVFGYRLNESRKLVFEQIQENPKIVYDYIPTYGYQKVTLDDGSVKYVLGKTVYIGIDYGYFCNKNSAMRSGTNYFRHLLVFDEIPPVGLMAEFENKNLFLPLDYTCSPDNEELKALLTGEPHYLSPKSIQYDEDDSLNVNTELAYCIIGFLQSYSNKVNDKEEDLRKIIIKAPSIKTQELVKNISKLSHSLVGDMTFLSNYIDGSGVPLDYNMVFVDEFRKSELHINNHICINLFSKSMTNVDENYIYEKILELAEEGDNATIKKIIDYYLALDLTQELDYKFLYDLFIAIDSDRDVPTQEISKDFVSGLNKLSLSSAQKAKLWEKINNSINSGLTSKKASDINNAIAAVGNVLPANKSNLNITPETASWITNVIFGENSYLSKFVNASNVDSILFLADRYGIASVLAFYNALQQSSDITIWEKMLHFYYPSSTDIIPAMDIVLDNILSSSISKQEKSVLIKRLYPVGQWHIDLMSYILRHTEHIVELIDIVKTICLNSREELFSRIIQTSNENPNIIKAISPIVSEYYTNLIETNHNEGAKSLLAFVNKTPASVLNIMNLDELFENYADLVMDNPSKEAQKIIHNILSSNVRMGSFASERLVILNNLFDDEIPKKVDLDILLVAHKMNKETEFIRNLYELWMKTSPTINAVKMYVSYAKNLTVDIIEEIIISTWESRVRMIRENRKEYVLIIFDNVKWKRKEKKKFIKLCGNNELAKFLTKSDNFIKKIVRQIINQIKYKI